jgi:ankyrin repeat protein
MVVKLLIEAKADMAMCPAAILQAATGGYWKIVKMLLDAGVHPDQTLRERPSPLHAAAARGHLSVARLLIRRGASLNLVKNGLSALYLAADQMNCQAIVVDLLLANGADATLLPAKEDDFSPLYSAAARGHTPIVMALLLHKADPTGVTYGEIPLHAACRRGHLAVIAALLGSNGSLPHVLHPTEDGTPPLYLLLPYHQTAPRQHQNHCTASHCT